ncbi:hypothetical protein [Pedobacter sp.]|uniref:hypothetical protein n=1 Tax=Pedobacter sp. TaxID=1411316 RepID=UPI003D7F71F8
MENNNNDYKNIKGWGVDADPKNEPTYPMKTYTGDDHQRSNWERPVQQIPIMEVLKSNERPDLSAVYGATLPPKGLSGAIRRYAFKYSESSYGHWLPLLLADRINVVEGIVDDLKHGHVPNIFAERGWKAEIKYNPKGAAKKIITGVVVAAVICTLLSKKRKEWYRI